MTDWKSTVSGILSGLIGTLTSVMTFQVPSALLNPTQAHTWLWITVGCNLAAIIAKVWVGVITQNADARAVANAFNPPPATPAVPAAPVPPTAASLAATPKT